MIRIVLFLAVLLSVPVFAKIRILTFHYNQPSFIGLQYKTLKKFSIDDFELIVFNDAKTEENERLIEEACREYQIQCVRFRPEWHLTDPLNAYLKMRLEDPSTIGWWGWNASTTNKELANHPSVRHCHVIQYALDHYAYDHDDIVVIWDGDNFLIKPLSLRKVLNSHDIVGFNQWPDENATQRKKWKMAVPKGMEMFWVVFIAFDPQRLPDVRKLQLHVDVVTGHSHLPNNTIVDTGAAIYKYLWKHPDLHLQAYPWQSSYTLRCMDYWALKKLQLSDRLIQLINEIAPENIQLFCFEHFLHIGAGSWDGVDSGHNKKLSQVCQFIEDIVR